MNVQTLKDLLDKYIQEGRGEQMVYMQEFGDFRGVYGIRTSTEGEENQDTSSPFVVLLQW